MLQALLLFDEEDKKRPKTIITETYQISKELQSIGVGHNIYPVDPVDNVANSLHTKKINESIKTIQLKYQCAHYDLASIGPKYVGKYEEVKKRNSKLHWHEAPETRLFLHGGGAFGIYIAPWLGICLVTSGGFISIPEKTYHWFDYGKIDQAHPPEYDVIRFWKNIGSIESSMLPHPAFDINISGNWTQAFPTYDVLLKSLTPNDS
tara:strand:+ start:281 stop:898 length:618 start_codon:yes stop_codon:yes gene_type:complete